MQEQNSSSEIQKTRKNDAFLRTIREIKGERDQSKRDARARLVGAFLVSVGIHAFLLVIADMAIS